MREERLGEVFQGFEALAFEKEKSEKRMGLGREKERTNPTVATNTGA